MDLSGAVILVTGGAGGLGAAIVSALASAGAQVVVLDRVAPADGPQTRALQLDLTDDEAVDQALADIVAELGPVSGLVNNAGRILSEPFGDLFGRTPRADRRRRWREVIEVNLGAVFSLSMAVVDHMLQTRTRGVIVNISSVSARGIAGQSAYAASKAGVEALSRTWAKELGPMGIRSCAVAPGFFDTSSTHAALAADHLQTIRREVPLRRLGRAEEVAAAVCTVFENDYLNGAVIPVDGGFTP